jgi:hypothetical protein
MNELSFAWVKRPSKICSGSSVVTSGPTLIAEIE